MPYCPDCGASVEADEVYCSSCGYRLQDDAGGPPPSDEGTSWDEREVDPGPDDTRPPDDTRQPEDYDAPPSEPPRNDQPDPRGGGYDDRDEHSGGYDDRGYDDRGYDDRGGYAGGGGYDQRSGYDDRGYDQPPRRDTQSEKERYIEDGKFSYALFFPVTGGYRALGFGALCYLLSFLIIPVFTLLGYVYRVIEAATYGDTVQPRFEDPFELTKDGFFFFLVYLAFGIVTFVAIMLAGGIGIAADSAPLSALLVVVVSILLGYIAPAVLVLYGASGDFGTAFSPERIREFAFTGKYLISYLAFIVFIFALQVVFALLAIALAITVIGIFLLIPLLLVAVPYFYYLAASYWGAVYFEAYQEGLVEDPVAPEPTGQPPQGQQY